MMTISVVIPAYNEEERIGQTLRDIHAYLPLHYPSFEIIVVDDGSTDGTAKLVKALCSELQNLTLLPRPQNRGKGSAVRAGMLAAIGDIRIFTDADGSTSIDQLGKLINPLVANVADIAIASRYMEGVTIVKSQPRLRVKWSRFTNKIIQRMLLPGIADPHCGFKAFTADAAQTIFAQSVIDGWSFDLEVLALALKNKLRVIEVPVVWQNDERSKAKKRHLPKEFYNVWKIRQKVRKL